MSDGMRKPYASTTYFFNPENREKYESQVVREQETMSNFIGSKVENSKKKEMINGSEFEYFEGGERNSSSVWLDKICKTNHSDADIARMQNLTTTTLNYASMVSMHSLGLVSSEKLNESHRELMVQVLRFKTSTETKSMGMQAWKGSPLIDTISIGNKFGIGVPWGYTGDEVKEMLAKSLRKKDPVKEFFINDWWRLGKREESLFIKGADNDKDLLCWKAWEDISYIDPYPKPHYKLSIDAHASGKLPSLHNESMFYNEMLGVPPEEDERHPRPGVNPNHKSILNIRCANRMKIY